LVASRAESATQTLTFAPVADTWVDASAPSSNLNNDVALKVDGSPIAISYLRFTVTGVNGRPVQQARLRLGVSGISVFGGSIHKISNNTWTPTTVNSNSRPAVDGPTIASLGSVSAGSTVEFVLDGAITGDGTYNLAIDSTNADAVSYNSKEATSGQKPSLV